ncbi:MAG: hypothetical protein MI685_12190 [Chlorobiales bacterium]|nr:hypothetical protein [Chlorobiales bacterium]
MPSLRCKLLCHSVSPHLQQLYTGFGLLAKRGVIELTQNICNYGKRNAISLKNYRDWTHAHLRVELFDQNKKRIVAFFDNQDGEEIEVHHLEECDIYFKRSYSSHYISKSHHNNKEKIYPLGLNYKVLPDTLSLYALQRSLLVSDPIVKMARSSIESVDSKNLLMFHPRLCHLQSLPLPSLEPKVLFMVTAYNPDSCEVRNKEEKDERIHNNEFRAACIRALRKELGQNFYGGFIHNKFTKENYSDLLIDNAINSKKGNYLNLLRKYPICVATTGLEGSIGWKFAEYVAFSKAIITEKLQYDVPGNLMKNVNYLEFSMPYECVEKAMQLINDPDLRKMMMINNWDYYRHYVAPDMMILNALSIAMKNIR